MHFTLKFLKHLPLYDDVQPYKIYDHPELSPEEQSNCEFEVISNVLAQDMRSCEHSCRLEKEGFEMMNSPSSCDISEVFENGTPQATEAIAAYIEEMMALVKRRTEASSVVAIDWRVFRRNNLATSSQTPEPADFRSQAIAVATIVHCDFSPDGGRERIQMHLNSDEWEAVKSGTLSAKVVKYSHEVSPVELQLICTSVWRPLYTVKNAPLVLSDRRSVSKSDLIEVDQVMTDKVTKTAFVYHQANQKWFWLSDQSPDEIFVFETWTPASDRDHADYSPHAAAYLHSSSDSMEPRESVEVRMIVLQEY